MNIFIGEIIPQEYDYLDLILWLYKIDSPTFSYDTYNSYGSLDITMCHKFNILYLVYDYLEAI